MESFKFFIFNKFPKMLKNFFSLLYHYSVCSVDRCGKKRYLKQFNRQKCILDTAKPVLRGTNGHRLNNNYITDQLLIFHYQNY